MADRLRFRLVTPERKVLEVECDEVQLPGVEGYFGVLPGHTPLISLLKIGEASYRILKAEHYLAVGEGFAEVSDDAVTVLSDFAQLPEEIDIEKARQAQAEAEIAIRSAGPETFGIVNAKLETAITQLQVASRR